jgi:alkylhydroperoxidase/carboxymuconolactone decarboxylase family protein YurZ
MTTEKEFFNIKYKQGSLDPKTAQLVFFAACIAIGHEGGARRHLKQARECGATEDEITEAMVYAMRPAAAKVRDLAKAVIAS